MNAITTRV